jgi:hypothetical protein
MNQQGVVPDAESSSVSAHAGRTVDLDAEHGSKRSLIEVELRNVRESWYEPGIYQVDVYRFLNGFPTKNEFILLHATRHGTLLCDSVPIIPNKRYRVISFSEKIKSGDILQVRVLIRFEGSIRHEI